MKLIRSSAKEAASFRWLLVLLAAVAGIQLLLPDGWKIRCLFREWSGHPCATCGATRCLQLILSGDWAAALRIQPLVFSGILIGGLILVYSLLAVPLKLPLIGLKLETSKERIFAGLLLAALVAANWVYLLRYNM